MHASRLGSLLVLAATACSSSDFLVADPSHADDAGMIDSLDHPDGVPPVDSGVDSGARSDAAPPPGDARDADVGPLPDATLDAPPLDSSPPPCPTKGGPMVRVGPAGRTFCIDAFEVRETAYAAFLFDKAGVVSSVAPRCKWNATYSLPADCGFNPAVDPNLPVGCADWCDAADFCDWAGKRLCGGVGTGAPIATSAYAGPTSEWMTACSHNADGLHLYPYGASFDGSACNAPGTHGTGLVPVGSKTGCEGGYPGLFDLSGNVEEWENACDADPTVDTGTDDRCRARGGLWYPPGDTDYLGQCNADKTLTRSGRAGFRCCAP